MSYSICGLIVLQGQAAICAENKWPCVELEQGVCLIPLERDYLLLVKGDETEARDDMDLVVPEWLGEMLGRFAKAAYIEAEFFGGTGMQASFVWEAGEIVFGPEISSGAINGALRRLGIADGPSGMLFGLPVVSGKDPFDIVGLGQHRSVEGWLKKAAGRK